MKRLLVAKLLAQCFTPLGSGPGPWTTGKAMEGQWFET